MGKKAEQPRLTQEQILAAMPVRLISPEVTPRANGAGAIRVPLAQRRWPFRLPPGATKTFELDAVGLFVWKNLDGDTTVKQLVQRLAKEYRLNLREAQVPTLKFLETLMRKGLVGLPVVASTDSVESDLVEGRGPAAV